MAEDFDEYGDSVEPEEGGNFLTKKVGPLPTWGWLLVAVAAWYVYKKGYLSSLTSGLTGSSTQTTNPTGDIIDPGVGQTPNDTIVTPNDPTVTPDDPTTVTPDDPINPKPAPANPSQVSRLKKRIKQLTATDTRLNKEVKTLKKGDKTDNKKIAQLTKKEKKEESQITKLQKKLASAVTKKPTVNSGGGAVKVTPAAKAVAALLGSQGHPTVSVPVKKAAPKVVAKKRG